MGNHEESNTSSAEQLSLGLAADSSAGEVAQPLAQLDSSFAEISGIKLNPFAQQIAECKTPTQASVPQDTQALIVDFCALWGLDERSMQFLQRQTPSTLEAVFTSFVPPPETQ